LLGRTFGNVGELIVGLERGQDATRLAIGSEVLRPGSLRTGLIRAALTLDRLDSLDFPTHGYLLQSDLELAEPTLGSDERYRRWSTEYSTAFGGRNASILLTARYQTALSTHLPLSRAFALGGFLNLSGLVQEQLLANETAFVRAVYRTRFLHGNTLLPDLYAGVSLEAAELRQALDPLAPAHLFSGSFFLSAQSVLGQLYLGTGAASGGHGAIYLTVGRPWP
jgi:hypothetical protein